MANCYEDEVDPDNPENILESAYEKAGKIVINRIHRYGIANNRGQRNRPIIVNFQCYLDRDFIMSNKKSMPEGIYVNEDFPYEIKQRRMALLPILKEALKIPKYRGKIKLRYDKLIVYGKEYTMGTIDQLPADIHPSASCETENTEVLAFFGMHSEYSNFHKASFKVNGESYNCAEQYIQSEKAKHCDDDMSRHRIMNMKDPREMKRQGSKLKNFIPQKWEQTKAKEVAYQAVKNKFMQNPHLMDKLKRSGNITIVEASKEIPWGCGLGLRNPGALISSSWTNGPGLMSEVLMRVRSEIK